VTFDVIPVALNPVVDWTIWMPEFEAGKGIADWFVDIPGQTRTGIWILDPDRGQTTDINFPGLPPPDAVWNLARQVGITFEK
jgi:fructose-1-phosphate kinase PfkB-like protein